MAKDTQTIGINIGIRTETVNAYKIAVIDTLKVNRDREVTIAALQSLSEGLSVNHASISDCIIKNL